MYRVKFGYNTVFDFKSWKEASGFTQEALDNNADNEFSVNITRIKGSNGDNLSPIESEEDA